MLPLTLNLEYFRLGGIYLCKFSPEEDLISHTSGTDSYTEMFFFMHCSTLFVIDSVPIIRSYTCTGGAQPLAPKAHAPVCPTMAMLLGNKICTHTILYAQP